MVLFYFIDITGVNSIISSPNYPDVYPANVEYFWVARIPIGKKIALEFLSFELEGCGECR